MLSLKHNYHTHTVWCHHAYNTVEEMIKAAIKFGYKTIGFSEHAPLKVRRNFRLNLNEVDDYINEVNIFKKKYRKKINVLCGLECEYHGSEKKYYQDLKNKKGIDYMIVGNHNMGNPHNAQEWNVGNVNIDVYTDQLIDAMESGIFNLVAHPDFIFRYYPFWDKTCEINAKRIIDCSIKNNIPLEFNLNGLANKRTQMDYPNDKFWEMVSKTNVKVSVNTDAHQIDTLNKIIVNWGFKVIEQWNLKKNIIDKLNI